jgi:hypothetical protein
MKVSVHSIVEFCFVHRSDFFALSGYLSMAAVRYQSHTRELHRCGMEVLLKLRPPALINHQSLAPTRLTIGYY